MRNKRQPHSKNERRPVIDSGSMVPREGGSVIMRGPLRGSSVGRGGGKGAVKFLVLLAIVGAGYWALGTYRNELVERVPAAYPILKAIGIEVEEPLGYGIDVTSRADRVQDENRQWVVYVRGKLRNKLDRRVQVPRIQITVTASNSAPLVWTVEPELPSLAPGQQIDFQTRYSIPFALRDLNARVGFQKR
jgi:hypothetical protein